MENWQQICALEEIPLLGARVVQSDSGDIALFRTAEDEIFALRDSCPHKGGALSQGLVFDKMVACPLHGWKINLDSGIVEEPDRGVVQNYQVRIAAGQVFLKL